MFCIGAAKDLRFEYPALLTAVWRDWAKKIWKYSTTIARGLVFQPTLRRLRKDADLSRVERHERVHVRQSEDRTFLALLIGLLVWAVTGDWQLGLGLWLSGPLWQLPNFITALRHLRKKPENVSWYKHVVINTMYRQSEHERHAYTETN
jgi:hypothetical protein